MTDAPARYVLAGHESEFLTQHEVRALVAEGSLNASTQLRSEGGTRFIALEYWPEFAGLFAAAPPTAAQAVAGYRSEAMGVLLLLIPVAGLAFLWLWVAQMNLLEAPGSKIAGITTGVIVLTMALAAVEASLLDLGRDGYGPVAWCLLFLLLWIVAFPAYLSARSRRGLRSFAVVGALAAIGLCGSAVALASAVEAKKTEVRRVIAGAEDRFAKQMRKIEEPPLQLRASGGGVRRSIPAGFESYYTLKGSRYLFVRADLTLGIDAESQAFVSPGSFQLREPNGVTVKPQEQEMMAIDNALSFKNLSPGGSISGLLLFDLPNEIQLPGEFTLLYDDGKASANFTVEKR